MALTLIMVYAIAEFYSYVGDTVRDGRAIIEMGGNLRTAVDQLQDDLNAVTVRPVPPITPGQGAGFFEYVEGVATDIDVNGDGSYDVGTMLGDTDDILSMTIRAAGSPFVGRIYNASTGNYDQIESNLAEVVWFTTFKDRNSNFNWDVDEERFVVRRVLLIRPDLTLALPPAMSSGENLFHHCDVSAHWSGTAWIANSLDDLTQRENRFIHLNFRFPGQNVLANTANNLPGHVQLNPNRLLDATNYPNNDPDGRNLTYYTLQTTVNTSTGAVRDFLGEDHVLPNVLAFDVRAYDPLVPLLADNSDLNGGVIPMPNDPTSTDDDDALAVLAPGDPGYLAAIIAGTNSRPIAGYGAYVDLWFNRGLARGSQGLAAQGIPTNRWPNSIFSWAPDVHSLPAAFHPQPGLANEFANSFPAPHNQLAASFDTWSTYYERDGYDQDATDGADQGTDGEDSNMQGGVDDATEHETHPPYPAWVGENGVDDDMEGTIDEPVSNSNPPDVAEGGQAQPPILHLRGIQVRIRLYEPGTRQTRQATVVTDFVPE